MKLLAGYRPGSKQLRADLSGTYSSRGPFLLLMRHGRVDTGPGRMFLGQTDPALDETGRTQARAWQPELDLIPLSGIYTSALERTRQTAALCCPGRVPVMDPRINEIDMGDWDGCSFEDIRTRFPNAFYRRGRDLYRYRPPAGESFEDVHGRAAPFFKEVEGRMKGQKAHVLVITHAGVIRALCCHWAGMPMDSLFSFKPAHGDIWVLAAG